MFASRVALNSSRALRLSSSSSISSFSSASSSSSRFTAGSSSISHRNHQLFLLPAHIRSSSSSRRTFASQVSVQSTSSSPAGSVSSPKDLPPPPPPSGKAKAAKKPFAHGLRVRFSSFMVGLGLASAAFWMLLRDDIWNTSQSVEGEIRELKKIIEKTHFTTTSQLQMADERIAALEDQLAALLAAEAAAVADHEDQD